MSRGENHTNLGGSRGLEGRRKKTFCVPKMTTFGVLTIGSIVLDPSKNGKCRNWQKMPKIRKFTELADSQKFSYLSQIFFDNF